MCLVKIVWLNDKNRFIRKKKNNKKIMVSSSLAIVFILFSQVFLKKKVRKITIQKQTNKQKVYHIYIDSLDEKTNKIESN